ncbi:MAG: tetratricopeptide repeat protein [Gemmatimonadota bacterium]|jgi:tetratricopeptide (TPR) repeat protein
MTGYTTREVAQVLGLAPRQVRSFARSGLLEPRRGPRNEYRFSFPDIILMRAARELREAKVPARRIRAALRSLGEQLPEGRPLSAVRILAEGEHVIVRDRDTLWEPASEQVTLDFSVGELAAKVQPFAPRAAAERAGAGDLEPDEWFDLGLDLEAVSPDEATHAYRRALELDPHHAESHLNLGRLLHEAGHLEDAEAHYREAVAASPGSGLAWFNLGVALEDLGRRQRALEVYGRAVELDPELPAAHFNLARLYEQQGSKSAAVRHLSAYKRLRERAG